MNTRRTLLATAAMAAVMATTALPAAAQMELKLGQMAADPQVLARDMVVDLQHPVAGPTKALGLPIKLAATPGGVRRPAPTFGQHTREVLLEAGFGPAEIDALAAEGAIRLGA